jgi:hypothetical protein
MDTIGSFIWIIIFFDERFKYDDGARFLVYFGINAELFCEEFYKFVLWQLAFIESETTVLNWHGNDTIMKTQFHFMVF